jgi:microcystin degradation protein MlrC
MSTGVKENMGKTVVLTINGIDVVITEHRRTPINDPELFRSVGIEPKDKKMIEIKQSHHWRAAYEPIAKKIISVECPTDYSVATNPINPLTGESRWPYRHIRRPIWPWDKDAKMW